MAFDPNDDFGMDDFNFDDLDFNIEDYTSQVDFDGGQEQPIPRCRRTMALPGIRVNTPR